MIETLASNGADDAFCHGECGAVRTSWMPRQYGLELSLAAHASKAELASSAPIRNGFRMEIGRRRQSFDEELECDADRVTCVVARVVGRREPFNVPVWRDLISETGRDIVVGSRRHLARIIRLPLERLCGVVR